MVQNWAQQTLGAGGAAAIAADPLLEVLHQLGATGEVAAEDRLVEDLHLDSLAMVQLQSALETRFGLELGTTGYGAASAPSLICGGCWSAISQLVSSRRWCPNPRPSGLPAPPVPVQTSPGSKVRSQGGPVFPQWPAWQPVRLLRNIFLEVVMRPLVWLLLGPRIAPRNSRPPALPAGRKPSHCV